jgi:hypothetical protein
MEKGDKAFSIWNFFMPEIMAKPAVRHPARCRHFFIRAQANFKLNY